MKKIYIIVFSMLLMNCGSKEEKQTKIVEDTHHDEIHVTKVQFESENMKLGKLSKQTFNDNIPTTGYIDVPPKNKASVSTFMSGYVKQTPLLVGDEVKKGQKVVTLENPEFVELQQNYLEVFEKLNYLKSEYERQEKLFKEKITSQKNFLKAESEYKSNLAHYNGLKQKLQMLNISPEQVQQGNIRSTINLYAPINGYVTKVNVSNGSFVDASTEVVEIVDTDHIHLELKVYEKDVLNVKKGQPIQFKIPEASSQLFHAEVYLVGTSIDETTRTIEVHGHLDEEEEKQSTFVRGMFIEAQIITNTANYESLPLEAVAEVDEHFYVLVLKGMEGEEYVFEKVELNIGKKTESFVQILNVDIFENKQILTKGAFMLLADTEGGGHSH